MAITEAYAGAHTISAIGTEDTLNTTSPETTAGVYQVWIDLANMVSGDVLEIRVKEKVTATSTEETTMLATYSGAQPEPHVTPSLILLHGWDVTLKQTAGTARIFNYSIRKVA